ncbi:hypothetical protein B0H34DRAFT_736549 [Crassisporium funariophilum]|nr:hypothetical protein B0H34DRAFT_736549 [Crassisporium funariophilum]
MTMSSTAVRVELFPAPPPTNNNLDPEQRSRRLRSTRKLGAVLGTTPFLLEPESRDESTSSLPSPRTRAVRREGRIFHSHSSSISSVNSTEPDYVLVNSSSHSAPYQFQTISPSSSRSPSPTSHNVHLVSKRHKGADGKALAPISITLDLPGSQVRSGTKARAKGPQVLAQPLLLRLRSVPVPPTDARIKCGASQVEATKPLSPVVSSFNMDITPSSYDLTDRERRKKMAKLTRTLGENIPPELVFRSPPTRKSSLAISRPRAFSSHKPAKSITSATLPPLPVAETPAPAPQAVVLDTEKSTKRKRRPRSLTLSNAPPIAAPTRGANSLDAAPAEVQRYQAQKPFVVDASSDKKPKQGHAPAMSMEWGRRKEREWSGEWNKKDMEDVTRALRGLKGR